MIEYEHHEQDLLRRARRGLSPKSGDAERIRSQVAAFIASGAPAPFGVTPKPPMGLVRRLIPMAAVALGLSAAGGVGYGFGLEVGSARALRSVASDTPPVTARSEPAIPPDATEAREAPGSTSAAPPKPPTRTLTVAPSAGQGPVDPSLGDEARLLARVERALRDGNPRLAGSLLGELDRTTPGGQLVEERHAARIIAQCQLGSEGAGARAREFTARYPRSAYRSRIHQTCRETLE